MYVFMYVFFIELMSQIQVMELIIVGDDAPSKFPMDIPYLGNLQGTLFVLGSLNKSENQISWLFFQ